ncbi:hypothetical protein ACIQZG_11640 [Lysinibacillus sp. NPDC096418]|uniref:hypothetical protein n=1 Tax=Lysinibacillus sp. NPDC096418 TaxID=3364138 RepID=UPI0038203FEC
MQLHFYVNFESIERIETGKVTEVWNKSITKETDIHISIDIADYNVFRTENNNVYRIGKRVWKT